MSKKHAASEAASNCIADVMHRMQVSESRVKMIDAQNGSVSGRLSRILHLRKE